MPSNYLFRTEVADERQRGQGRIAGRAAGGGAAAHQGRSAPRRRVLGRRRRVRDRGPLPAPRFSRFIRGPSKPGSSRATGTTRGSTSCRAARSTCGPTTRAASTSNSAATTCSWSRACTPTPSATCRRGCATGSKTTSRSWSRSRCSGSSTRACPHRRSCAPAWSSALAYRSTGWGAGLTVLIAMANLLPQLDARRPGARARARPHVRRARHGQSRASLRGRRARDAGGPGRPARELVPAVRRHPLGRRRGTHARDRAGGTGRGSATWRR